MVTILTRQSASGFFIKQASLALILVLASVTGKAASAAEHRLVLDPDATKIRFFLGATLHTVEGSARLVEGKMQFDPSIGSLTGLVRVDARSATTGIGMRDSTMHGDVLESERFGEIVFRPERLLQSGGGSGKREVAVEGRLLIHGSEHRLRIPAEVVLEGSRMRVHARFIVPYAQWGMNDPSTFLLRVSKSVEVVVDGVGTLEPPVADSE